MCASKVVLVHVDADASPLASAGLLIEAEMDSAVDACVVDVVGDVMLISAKARAFSESDLPWAALACRATEFQTYGAVAMLKKRATSARSCGLSVANC
jgi:hypothetical protein